jgi:hypothetical protein
MLVPASARRKSSNPNDPTKATGQAADHRHPSLLNRVIECRRSRPFDDVSEMSGYSDDEEQPAAPPLPRFLPNPPSPEREVPSPGSNWTLLVEPPRPSPRHPSVHRQRSLGIERIHYSAKTQARLRLYGFNLKEFSGLLSHEQRFLTLGMKSFERKVRKHSTELLWPTTACPSAVCWSTSSRNGRSTSKHQAATCASGPRKLCSAA